MRGFRNFNIGIVLLYVVACAVDWSAEFVAPELKHAKLRTMLQRMESFGGGRKIVFVGTSPCDYGIDAGQIEKELGIATFNTCHNGYDTPQIVQRVSAQLSDDDVLVYVARYPQDYGHPVTHNKPEVASILPNPFPRFGHWLSDGRYTDTGDQTVYGAAVLENGAKATDRALVVPTGYWQETLSFLKTNLAGGNYPVVVIGAARPTLAVNEQPGITTLTWPHADTEEVMKAHAVQRDVTFIPPVKITDTASYLDSLHLNQQGRTQWSKDIAEALRSTVLAQ